MADVYSDFARVYDELMDNAPYGDWCENIASLIREYGISRPVGDRVEFCPGGITGAVRAKPSRREASIKGRQSDGPRPRIRRLCWRLNAIWY